METFSELLALCAGNSPVPGEFPTQRPVKQSFDVFFDLHRNNGWVNNGEAGDLRHHRAHYDVIVMNCQELTVAQHETIWHAIKFNAINQSMHGGLNNMEEVLQTT